MVSNFYDPEVVADIVNMYEGEKDYDQVHSTYTIAKKYDTYPGKVRSILLKQKVKLRTKKQAQKAALKNGVAKHPTKGKKHSKEAKRKISIGRYKAWKEMPEEERAEFCKQAAKRWADIPFDKKIEMQRLAGAALHKSSIEGSKAERFLYQRLLEDDFVVEMHKTDLVGGEYEVDLYLPELLTAIEIDGPQHFLPVFGEEQLNKSIRYDSTKNGVIIGKGFAIIRVKYLANKISDRVKRDLYNCVIEQINKIEKKFPEEGSRLIEVTVE